MCIHHHHHHHQPARSGKGRVCLSVWVSARGWGPGWPCPIFTIPSIGTAPPSHDSMVAMTRYVEQKGVDAPMVFDLFFLPLATASDNLQPPSTVNLYSEPYEERSGQSRIRLFTNIWILLTNYSHSFPVLGLTDSKTSTAPSYHYLILPPSTVPIKTKSDTVPPQKTSLPNKAEELDITYWKTSFPCSVGGKTSIPKAIPATKR